jgi:hypothetical protein
MGATERLHKTGHTWSTFKMVESSNDFAIVLSLTHIVESYIIIDIPNLDESIGQGQPFYEADSWSR